MIEQLKRVVRRQTGATPLRECRRCGTTIEGTGSACPACDSTDIAQYEL